MRLSAVAVPVLVALVTAAHAFDCKRNEHGVFEDNACATQAMINAQDEMKDVYEQLRHTLDTESVKLLEAAQERWLEYQDAHAQFVYGTEGSGSAGAMVVQNAREHATRARTEELRLWLPR